jgi:chaperonin GroES
MLKPLDDKVVVRPIEEDQTTSSGFVLVGQQEKPQMGEVIAVGPGLTLGNGDKIIPDLNVGDKVFYSKYQGTEVEHDGQDLLILAYRDIFAVVNE